MTRKAQVSGVRRMQTMACNHRGEWQTVWVRRSGYAKVWQERRCPHCGRLAQG